MAKIILVASGKGGVGKSTVSALLGEAFAFGKSPVLLVELDSGLRSLDVALGVSEQVVFDMGDIVGLVAPRVFIAVNGKDDGSFPLDSAKKQIEIASKVYKEVGAGDKIHHITGPEGHRFYAALAWPVFDELTGWK